ncbi:YaaR family protein [Pullulanibacillus sp. KACC 23026]|uniref:YaaR family protein n=1 Tax=Pullulanibacillus sp. KACC 23026 TaxID=3028315 RepID=UPI0023B075AC|nr:YaaR family protein [Pullulanibacillus sp. KACC 23026]WEG11258.1 YaaR family protein [Pullulanibacillus sp. KACC 23026]
MKIVDPIRVNLSDARPITNEKGSSDNASFQNIMNAYSKDLTQDKLQKLLQDIDQQGKQLNENPTFTQLRKYKDLVKQFMGEVSKNGVGLEQSQSYDLYGGSKTLKTVKVLDQKLMELTDHVLKQQSSGISLMDRIGEIKGLLINLYT